MAGWVQVSKHSWVNLCLVESVYDDGPEKGLSLYAADGTNYGAKGDFREEILKLFRGEVPSGGVA